MTARMRELLQLRDEFRRELAGVEGLVSVGFGKNADGPYLRVMVERGGPQPALPTTFRSLPVLVERGSRGVVALGSAAEIAAS